jgi:hypothetical protein
MSKKKQFGENVEGYNIPVLNEREIRAAAGIFFVLMLVTILIVILKENFTPFKFSVVIFFVDFLIRVLISPRYAPTLILGRWIVRKQVPEYVGAAQKKFAWWIGFGLTVIMMVLVVAVNSYSIISGLICLICLLFLFFETSFGICLGCKFYPLFHKGKVQYCPGEVCEIKDMHEIQKTNWVHFVIVLGFVAFIVFSVIILKDSFALPPQDLFEMMK